MAPGAPPLGAHGRVLFVNAQMDHYRIPFYELLRAELNDRGIDLQVAYGVAKRVGAERSSAPTELQWGHRVDNRVYRLGGRELWWQPCLDLVRTADLVIVEQASKRLLNYLLLLRQSIGRGRVALWGHGRNFKTATLSPAGEAVKRYVSRMPHWWFAYNDLSASVVRDLGFPEERITSVQNAIDTRALTAAFSRLDQSVVERLRQEMGLRGQHVGIFCGGIYAEKRTAFMVAAALAARSVLPDFELIVVGDGVEAHVLEEAAKSHPWIHFMGPRFDEEKVACFALADVFFLPGLVGLALLDSFALETPMVASASADHSPEIHYLEDGVNGLLVDDGGSPDVYAKALTDLLADKDRYGELVQGCRDARERYTIEAMASRFAEGIVAALAAPRR